MGLDHEVIFYDAQGAGEAHPHCAQPHEAERLRRKVIDVFIECVQTIFLVNGVATPLTPCTAISMRTRHYGWPWAALETLLEQEMRSRSYDIFSFE